MTLILIPFLLVLSTAAAHDWLGWGGGSLNNRWAKHNKAISSKSIKSLTHHCTIQHPIGASATPVVVGNKVYYPTWDGTFVALNYKTCKIQWQTNITTIITTYKPLTPYHKAIMTAGSRTSPQISGDIIFLGTLVHALVLALNRTTGDLLGAPFQINPYPYAAITQSPTLFQGTLFIGSSSADPPLTSPEGILHPHVTGVFVALRFNPSTKVFNPLWNISTIPPHRLKQGWTGASVWGSQPAIDTRRRTVYIGTGQAHLIPPSVITCQVANQFQPYTANDLDLCLPSDVWLNSVLAINIDTGKVRWVFQAPGGVDAWNFACGYTGSGPQDETDCPQVPGPDADFGMAPAFVASETGNPRRDSVVIGRKNGVVYSLSAETGQVVWSSKAGPGGVGGGMVWGIAVDDARVYYAIVNTGYLEYRLTPSNATVHHSIYGALDLANGSILWQTPVPGVGGFCHAPPSVVGDVVLVVRTGLDPLGDGSYDQTKGGLVALEKETGEVLVDYELESNSHSGIAVKDGFLFVGTGYYVTRTPVSGGFHVFRVGRGGSTCRSRRLMSG